MSDLDKRLFDVLFKRSSGLEEIRIGSTLERFSSDKWTVDTVEQIKQALIDAGYVQREWHSVGTINGKLYEHVDVYTPAKLGFEPVEPGTFAELKTGQQWYDRFMKRFELTFEYPADFPILTAQEIKRAVLVAAKKAAGIDV